MKKRGAALTESGLAVNQVNRESSIDNDCFTRTHCSLVVSVFTSNATNQAAAPFCFTFSLPESHV